MNSARAGHEAGRGSGYGTGDEAWDDGAWDDGAGVRDE